MTPMEIATALGRINRWAGRGAFALSIAQHQTVLSYAVPPRLARAAHIHDVSELVMGGDVISPIKTRCPDFEREEEQIQRRLCDTFQIPFSEFLEQKPFDERIRFDEKAALWPDDEKCVAEKVRGLGVVIEPMTPEAASAYWLYRFVELFLGGF